MGNPLNEGQEAALKWIAAGYRRSPSTTGVHTWSTMATSWSAPSSDDPHQVPQAATHRDGRLLHWRACPRLATNCTT